MLAIAGRTSKRSDDLRTSPKSRSATPCGSCSRWMAANDATDCSLAFESLPTARTARLSLRFFFAAALLVVAPSRPSPPRSSPTRFIASSWSSSSESSAASSCAPSRKCSAETRSLTCGQKSAPATTLTVLASRHTRRRYSSIIVRIEYLAATSDGSPIMPMTKFCSARLSWWSERLALTALMSEMTYV